MGTVAVELAAASWHGGVASHYRDLQRKTTALNHGLLSGSYRDTLEELVGYMSTVTLDRLAAEDEAMERAGYPCLAAHRRQHAEFAWELRAFGQRVAEASPSAAIRVYQWTSLWLVKHVANCDSAFEQWREGRRGGRANELPSLHDLAAPEPSAGVRSPDKTDLQWALATAHELAATLVRCRAVGTSHHLPIATATAHALVDLLEALPVDDRGD